jgi:hypothetical protein
MTAEQGPGIGEQAAFEISPESMPLLRAMDAFGEELQTSTAYREIDVFDLNKFAWVKMNGSYYVTARKSLSIAVHKEGREVNRITLSPEPSPPLPPDEQFSRIRRSRALPLLGSR